MRHAIIVLAFALLLPAVSFAADSDVTPVTPPAMTPAPNKPMPMIEKPKDAHGKKITSHLVADAPLKDDYLMGKSSAPVTIIEYASLSCPHCARFSNTTLVDIQKKYIDKGKVRYILRQYPLNEPALKGAILLDCVGQQDKAKYFVFAKVLFDAQDKWAFDGNYLSGLETIATVGGLSKEQFAQCVNNTDREMRVLGVKKAATDELHIPHTPYIIVNGEEYTGDNSTDSLSAVIDAKLAGAKK